MAGFYPPMKDDINNTITEIQVLFKFKRKIRTSDLRISSLALYHLSYPDSIESTGLNLPLESNTKLVHWSIDDR